MNIGKMLVAMAMVLILSPFNVLASENPMLVRIDLTGEMDIVNLRGIDIDIQVVKADYAEAVVYPSDLEKLRSRGLSYAIIYEDLVAFYRSRNPLALDMGGFPTLSEAIDIMDSLAATYPAIVSAKWSIGSSWEGRDLWVFKISDNVNVDEDEPEVFYNSLIHAREPAGMTWILHFAGWLCENYTSDSVASYIVDNRELFFLPVFNPDGYEYNRLTNPGGGGMWRKNRRPGDGVDLNRNWGYMWGYDNYGSSPDPWSETYRGPAPFSEPETDTVRQFIVSRDFDFVINAHTYGEYLLYPWGYDYFYTPDQDFFYMVGDSGSTLTGYAHGTAWELLYQTNGDANDWCYGEQVEKPLIFAIAPESGNSYDGFWPLPSRIPEINAEMLPFGIYIAQLAGVIMGLHFDYPAGVPHTLIPAQQTSFDVTVSGVRGGEPVWGTGQLHYSVDGGPYVTIAMAENQPNEYTATLPALNCGSVIDFYITAEEVTVGTVSDPPDAPATTYSATPVTGTVETFNDNFENNLGWTTEIIGATSGYWERGVPVNDPNWDYDPVTDGDGSGSCYLTQNQMGNTDVDNGAVRLTSPVFDLSDGGIIEYYYYLYLTNTTNGVDILLVEINNNGGIGTWTEISRHDTNGSLDWRHHTITGADLSLAGVTPTFNMVIRFTANDADPQSIVEAGIDGVIVTKYECDQPDQIPTLSEWGMLILALLLLAAGTIAIIRKRILALKDSAK
ncbi:MAG: zinc carboxypeptidase [Candidatus Zixiibacteriota bacterium]|nr:MAG: zinc carboxypeptidase [candidate division Zixibacteria bacterium]